MNETILTILFMFSMVV